MSTVVRFPKSSRPLRREAVRVSATYQIDGAAPPNAGRLIFYVDLLRADGTELDLWEGVSRDGALAAAREWESIGVPIVDETSERAKESACRTASSAVVYPLVRSARPAKRRERDS